MGRDTNSLTDKQIDRRDQQRDHQASHRFASLGSGPNRGQNTVEMGDFPSVCLYQVSS